MPSRTRPVFLPAIKAGFDKTNLDAAHRILADPYAEGLMRQWAEEIVRKAERTLVKGAGE